MSKWMGCLTIVGRLIFGSIMPWTQDGVADTCMTLADIMRVTVKSSVGKAWLA